MPLELNVLLKLHLLEMLQGEGEDGSHDCKDAEATDVDEDGIWFDRAWRYIQQRITEAEEAAAQNESGEDPSDAVSVSGAADAEPTAPKNWPHHVSDEALARWLETAVAWEGTEDLLEVLRDELTSAMEV